jgi:hypothetical protein
MSQNAHICVHCGWNGPSKRPCCAQAALQLEPYHDEGDQSFDPNPPPEPQYHQFRLKRTKGGPLTLTSIGKSPKKRPRKGAKGTRNAARNVLSEKTQLNDPQGPTLDLTTTFGFGPSPPPPSQLVPTTIVCTSAEVYESQHIQFQSALRHAVPPLSGRVDIWRWLRPLDHHEKQPYERGVIPLGVPALSQRPKAPWVACLFCEYVAW